MIPQSQQNSPSILQKVLKGIFSNLSFAREFVLYTLSFVVFQGSRFLIFLWAAKILGVATFGVWNMLNLILVYSGLIHLGVLSGMNRDVPYYRGRKEASQVEEIKQVSVSFMSISTLLAALGLLIISFFIAETYRVPLQLMSLLLIATQFYNYIQTYLRADLRFDFLTYQQFVYALLFPLIIIPATLSLDFSGFIVGQSAAILLICIGATFLIPIRVQLNLNKERVKSLIKTGFPIMMVGLLYGLLTSTDRWIIWGMLGAEQLGFYSLAILVSGMLTLVPTAISMQVYPRMAETYGEQGKYAALKAWMWRQSVLSLIVIIPLALAVFFLMPIVVHQFLPEYVEGITAMKIILIGVVVLPLYKGFGAFLNTVGKQIYYMIVQGVAVLVNLGLNYLVVSWGWGINGVALGTSITHVLYTLTLILVSLWLLRSEEL